MNLEIGAQLGDYRLLSRIGKGSYGVVYEAEHAITRRIDALKLMLYAGPCAADDEQRFLREIQVQASLQHPNIAAVYTAFRTEWGPALVMELVRGESLRAVLERGRPPLEQGVAYVQAALRGLSCAEKLGIVHRDIKPENILITPDGEVKLTDFGLAHVANEARLTGSGENIGTPSYMSPEQVIATEPVDSRSDVYSAGIVLYEVATGRLPFSGTNGFAVMHAQRNTPPTPPIEINPAIGVRLNRIILTALEKDPARRFPSAADFHSALDDATAQPEYGAVPPMRFPRQHKLWEWMAAAAATAMSAGGFLMIALHVVSQHAAVPRVEAHSTVSSPKTPVPPPAPVAITPAAAPELPAAPIEVPASPVADDPPVEVVHTRPVRTRRSASTLAPNTHPAAAPALRFTAAEAQEQVAPAPSAVAEKLDNSQDSPPVATNEVTATTTKITPDAPASGSDPASQADKAADPSAKHHNPVVRAFGKLFHKKTSTDNSK